MRRVEFKPSFLAWRSCARQLLREGVRPEETLWIEAGQEQQPLPAFAEEEAGSDSLRPAGSEPVVRVPRSFLSVATRVARHRDRGRWNLLYSVLWRLINENKQLMEIKTDPQICELLKMEREVERDVLSRPDALPEPTKPAHPAVQLLPQNRSLPGLREAARDCTACDLYRFASQTVFGEGPVTAGMMLVGEQPGDMEDLSGRPFVGPAGEVLDRALSEAGLDRGSVYVTNAVKHFKFVARGKRRIHERPRMSEVAACRPWLEAEIEAVHPQLIVCLGATALQSLLGPQATLHRFRGRPITSRWAPYLIATYHPSAVLRAESDESSEIFSQLVADLRLAVATVEGRRASHGL